MKHVWLKEAKFSDTVKETWERVSTGSPDASIHENLNRMHTEFHDWDQRVLKKPKKRLSKAQKELEQVMSGPMSDENDVKKKELAELVQYLQNWKRFSGCNDQGRTG